MLKYLFLISFICMGISVFSQEQSIYVQRKNGKVKLKDDFGNYSKGKVHNHYKVGTWKYYLAKGFLVRIENYSANGLMNGPYIEYSNANLSVKTKGNYCNGYKCGEWISFYENGNESQLVNYDSLGNYAGVQEMWNKSEYVTHYTIFATDTLELDYDYFYVGAIKSITRKVNGQLDGMQIHYKINPSQGDSLEKTEEYKNGKLNGTTIKYSREGSKSSEEYYLNDQLDGKQTMWYPDGSVNMERFYKKGKRDSVGRIYDRNGFVTEEMHYSNGEFNGKNTTYRSNSEIPQENNWYTNGFFDSTYTYFESGKIESKEYPVRGFNKDSAQFNVTPITRYIGFDSLGRKTRERILLNGELSIGEKFFFPNGKMEATVDYKNEGLAGQFKEYNSNGKIILEGEVSRRMILTDPKAWDKNGKPMREGTPAFDKYVTDNLPQGISYGANGVAEELPPPPPPDTSIDEMPIMPEFPGGQEALMQYLHDNTKYPEMEREANIQGKVLLEFTVEKDGSISRINVRKEVPGAPDFTKEAIRVVQSMPKWTPGSYHGVPMAVQYTLPFNFVTK